MTLLSNDKSSVVIDGINLFELRRHTWPSPSLRGSLIITKNTRLHVLLLRVTLVELSVNQRVDQS